MKRIVFVVDDEFDTPVYDVFREAIDAIKPPFEFQGFTSCQRAIEALNTQTPYAILLDLNFPNEPMSGLDFLGHLKKNSITTPVLALTSQSNLAVVVQTMASGAMDYVPKCADDGIVEAINADLIFKKLAALAHSHYLPYSKRLTTLYLPKVINSITRLLAARKPTKNPIPIRKLEDQTFHPWLGRLKFTDLFKGSQSDTRFAAAIPELILFQTGRGYVKSTDLPITGGFDQLDTAKALQFDERPIILFHALTAAADSIALLADIGRAFRLMFALNAKSISVMLAGHRWAMTSHANILFEPDDSKRSQLISKNLQFRTRLYRALGIQFSLFDFPGLPHDNIAFEPVDVHSEVEEALRVLADFPVGDIENRLQLDEKVIGPISKIPGKRRLATLLRAAADIRGRLDEVVLGYILAQEKATIRVGALHGNFLKSGVFSEIDFDALIQERIDLDSPDAGRFGFQRVYFPHYEISGKRTLPYSPVSLDNVNRDIFDVSGIIPLNSDAGFPNDSAGFISEIQTSLRKSSQIGRARLLADCLSFYHLTIAKDSLPDKPDELLTALVTVDEHLADSLLYYSHSTKGPRTPLDLGESALAWVGSFDSIGFVYSRVPYYVIPYLWYEDEWEERLPAIATFIAGLLKRALKLVDDSGLKA